MIDDAMLAMMQAAHRCADPNEHPWDIACPRDWNSLRDADANWLNCTALENEYATDDTKEWAERKIATLTNAPHPASGPSDPGAPDG